MDLYFQSYVMNAFEFLENKKGHHMTQHMASQWKIRSEWKYWKRLAINKVLLSFRICM